MSNGKGDKQRPTDRKAYSEGWDRVFGKKKRPRGVRVFDNTTPAPQDTIAADMRRGLRTL